jgi:hypothetical protein
MSRFSIKDLLLATTLVAIGVAIEVAFLIHHQRPVPWWQEHFVPAIAISVGGMSMIGAGLLAPFHKKILGIAVGAAVSVVLTLAIAVLAALEASKYSGPQSLSRLAKYGLPPSSSVQSKLSPTINDLLPGQSPQLPSDNEK